MHESKKTAFDPRCKGQWEGCQALLCGSPDHRAHDCPLAKGKGKGKGKGKSQYQAAGTKDGPIAHGLPDPGIGRVPDAHRGSSQHLRRPHPTGGLAPMPAGGTSDQLKGAKRGEIEEAGIARSQCGPEGHAGDQICWRAIIPCLREQA